MSLPEYVVADPTGNITVLVTEPVPAAQQAAIAAELLAREPEGEQVGFLTTDAAPPHLRMAGGEFCANATLSAGAYLLSLSGADEGKIQLTVSGAREPLTVSLRRSGEGYAGKLRLPLPRALRKVTLPSENGAAEFLAVELEGITHLVLSAETRPEDPEKAVREWCAVLGADALGLMFLSADGAELTPLVYVPAADTLYWERSCASGSCAAAWYLAQKKNKAEAEYAFREPGGTLSVAVRPEGLVLTGRVEFRASNTKKKT